MRHRSVLTTAAAAALAAASPGLGRSGTLDRIVQQEIAGACAEIGVAADGSQVVDASLADRARVQEIAEHLLNLQKTAVAELAAAQEARKDADFQRRLRDALDVRDEALRTAETIRDEELADEIGIARAAENRVEVREAALTQARREYDGATSLRARHFQENGAAFEAAIGGINDAADVLRTHGETVRTLEAKRDGWFSGYLWTSSDAAALDAARAEIQRVGPRVEQAIETVNRVLEGDGREAIPGLSAGPGADGDWDAGALEGDVDRLRDATQSVLADVGTDRASWEQKSLNLKNAEFELGRAKTELARAKERLVQARKAWVPGTLMAQQLADAQRTVDELNRPYESAASFARAVQEIVAGARRCIDAAQASWASSGRPGATAAGSWSWRCEAVDSEGRTRTLNHAGTFDLRVVAGIRTEDMPAGTYTNYEAAVRFVRDDGESVTLSGVITPVARDGAGVPTQSRLEIHNDDTVAGYRTQLELTGTLFGDPMSATAMTGRGRLARTDWDLEEGNAVTLSCDGRWETAP